jgi:D-lactate dehydrogenase (cytochrome)
VDQKYLSDAAHFPGGHAPRLEIPRTIDEIPDIIRRAQTLLPIGAQSSLTGGATPMGEVVLSTEKLTRILELGDRHVRVEAGVSMAALQHALATRGAWFPPVPTFTGAFAGGIVATNAAGAVTFKYGSVRRWVDALTVVLADGTTIAMRRGDARARDGWLSVEAVSGRIDVPVPTYVMPDVVKRSAGYHAEPDMDLIDLFIGSEGTLGLITTVTFRFVTPAPAIAFGFVPCVSESQALALVRELRHASIAAWRNGDHDGIDAAAIEYLDRRCLQILHEDGADRKHDVIIPTGTQLALLVQLELPRTTNAAAAYNQIETALTDRTTDGVLARFCRMLDAHGVLDGTELAMPDQTRRAEALIALREAVPSGVNQRVGAAQRDIDSRIAKTAADMIVPFDRFAEMLEIYRRGFTSRGLDAAIWGHVSDGNVHPNVIPHSYEDVARGRDAILEFGRDATRLGGCPLAEHGVGRNAVKQRLLRELYGDDGIEEMRRVKRALDPSWKLAPGVIFPR